MLPDFCCCSIVLSHNRKFQTFQTLIKLRKGWIIFVVSSIMEREARSGEILSKWRTCGEFLFKLWWILEVFYWKLFFLTVFATERNRQILWSKILWHNFTFQGLSQCLVQIRGILCMSTLWDYFLIRILYGRNFNKKLRLKTSSRFLGISLPDSLNSTCEAVKNIVYSIVSMW